MTTEDQQPLRKRRVASQVKYAVYTLNDALDVARAIHDKGGGVASNDELAAFLDYKSSNNGAYYDRTSAARMFGLIQGQGAQISLTKRAEQMVMPVYPEQAAQARVEAFRDVPLFNAVLDEFQGKQLPPDAGLKNLLKTKYGVPPSRVEQAFRALMESADQAGFFSTRGTRTQLITPRLGQVIRPVAIDAPGGQRADDEAVPEAPRPPRRATSMEDLKANYISTLIEMLEKKGEPDPDLMAKIENLLGFGDGQG